LTRTSKGSRYGELVADSLRGLWHRRRGGSSAASGVERGTKRKRGIASKTGKSGKTIIIFVRSYGMVVPRELPLASDKEMRR